MPAQVPVTIISGFLGSGKTTLLLRLLAETAERGLRPGVLMNELGRLDVDGSILEEHAGAAVQKLLDGCVCCSKKGELKSALRTISEREPDLILIELTGVANPEEIVEAMTEPELREVLMLRQVVTVLDGEHVLDYNSIFAADKQLVRTLRRQIEVADRLLINKTDLVSAAKLAKIEKTIRKYNDRAPIHPTTHSRIEPGLLFSDTGLGSRSDADSDAGATASVGAHASAKDTVGLSISAVAAADNGAQTGKQPLEKPGAARTAIRGIRPPVAKRQETKSFSRIQTISLPWHTSGRATRSRVEKLLRAWEERVLRAKGYMRFEGDASVYLMQYAGKRTVWERSRYEGEPYVVFIGLDLDGERLAEQWQRIFE